MSNVRRLLSVLQNSDSFFPSGSMSFSWGLEALCATSRIDGAMSLREFVVGQVRHRWSTFDRVVLAHAHNVRHGDLDSLAELDCLVEAQSLVDELREGSRRNGQALLTVHDKLGTDGAGDYRRRILAGEAHGHLPVMQGFLWGTMGLGRDECQTMSAYGLCVNLSSAALRLGIVGHVDVQKVLTLCQDEIEAAISRPLGSLDDMHSFTPEVDVAVMRHEAGDGRLFAN